ncbi:MAG TPA: serine protease [Thermodesulfobacteriota bacterium]|nr:serine protease [Thermodesulfobacteriota bacterium]
MKELRNTAAMLVIGFFLCTGCTGLSETSSKEASLSSREMDTISEAVYEVVVLKPTKDSLQYEKPLPIDLLPYSVRTDKYYSIGTAFAISPSEFVSAAHVLNLGSGSQFKEAFLRDREGKVYAIEKVLKYSKNRDFIVFSLHNGKSRRFLPVNKTPRLNQKVYAVGNALGEGIVIRDGLYTSDTPEEEAGEWKWIRFSAAASPGNSGGPLLDQSGKVIGIVLRKSPSENLNYGVPIAEVLQADPRVAVVQTNVRYFLDNMDMTKRGILKKEISLPKTYAEFDSDLYAIMGQFSEKLLKDLLAENRDNIFPRGPGSTALFYKSYNAVFPHLIMKGRDGNWDAYHPRETKDAELGNNGRVTYGTLGTTVFLYLRKPDDVSLGTLCDDSKVLMDLILKGMGRYRQVGPENIKIVSMGKALQGYRFTDSYGRIWLVHTWLTEYDDRKVVTFSLPVPGGCVVMMRTDQTGNLDQGDIPDLKVLSDFIYVSYVGTFKEWQEFLTMRDLLPSVFSTVDIQIENNKIFRYKSARLSLSYGPEVMKISDKSYLQVDFSYFQEKGKTLWDVRGMMVTEEKYNQMGYVVYRMMKPPKDLGDEYQSNWENMVERRFPYNRSAYHKDKMTVISTIYQWTDPSEKGAAPSGSVLYTVGLIKDGNVDQKEMETKLEMFVRNLIVYEKGEPQGDEAGSG